MNTALLALITVLGNIGEQHERIWIPEAERSKEEAGSCQGTYKECTDAEGMEPDKADLTGNGCRL